MPIEISQLRNKLRVFEDRYDGGCKLAEMLAATLDSFDFSTDSDIIYSGAKGDE
jgi:hypothetical protein